MGRANEQSSSMAYEGHDVEWELKEIGKGYLRPTFITLQMVSLPHAFIIWCLYLLQASVKGIFKIKIYWKLILG